MGATLCLAGETRSWTQSDYTDFQKGNLKNLSIRSDGRLSLAPRTTELYDASTAYLWTLAQDSHGNLYTAGGPGAKLFRISPPGKGESVKAEKLAEFDALEIHAIAVDSKDRVYVATAPDGKIWRVAPDGKAEEFYNPKQKYIWAMLCDPAGNLYVATGDQGEVYKVTPGGKGEVFFKTEETHARSMAFDHEGNLIIGTDPGGLVIRISPKGEGFVVYQMPDREVTSVAVGAGNEIYAAAVGNRNGPPVIAGPAPPPASLTSGNLRALAAAPAPITVPGGSVVYRLAAQRAPEKLWSNAQDLVYALALDQQNRLLIGSGNKGALYRVENRSLYSTLVTFPVAQVTALLPGKDGALYAATGNIGKVFEIGPGLEPEGTIESDVFDTGGFSRWGRITASGDAHGGTISLTARSGNLDRPQENWSAWSKPVSGPDGGEVTAPRARFIQWKALLKDSPGGKQSPTIDSVDVAYLQQNVAPSVDQVDIAPANYKFPDPVAPLTASATITLPPIGSPAPSTPRPPTSASTSTPSLSYLKGFMSVRWAASDENGDTLIYKVEIRGAKEKDWKLLKDNVRQNYCSFDSTAFPDGEYRIRVIASDAPSNIPGETLTGENISDPFLIDNTPPRISNLRENGNVVTWHVADALSLVRKAEYSVDGGDWTIVEPVTKLSDAQALDYSLTLKNPGTGEHTIAVRVTDDFDNIAVDKLVR